MQSSLTPSVLIAHVTTLLNAKTHDSTDSTLFSFIISYLEKGIHPASVLSPKAIERFAELTDLNFSKLIIEGFKNPKDSLSVTSEPSSKTFSLEELLSNILNLSHNNGQYTACTHYSMALNSSSNYAYANNVNDPTCSHPAPPHGSSCPYGVMQTSCSMFAPDVKEDIFVVDDYSYKIVYQRTLQGMMNVYIYSELNLVNKLSYFIDKYRELTSQQVNDEICSIITEYHSNFYITSPDLQNTSFSNTQEKLVPVNSYISSLLS